jgi:hypothetical protein
MCAPNPPRPASRRLPLLLAAVLGGTLLTAPGVVGPTAAAGDHRPSPRPIELQRAAGSPLGSVELPVGPGLTRLAGDRFSMAALTWRGTWSGEAPSVSVRLRSAGRWGGWQELEPLEDGPDARRTADTVWGTELVWARHADAIRTRVTGRARDLTLVLIDPGRTPAATPTDTSTGTSSGSDEPLVSTRQARSDSVPPPRLRSRARWGADESWRSSDPRYLRTIKQVHVHHTVNSNGYRRTEVPGLIRGMYRYHTQSLGWSDIGYNFLVDRFGRAWVGRAGGAGRRVRGAHTLGFNHTSTGVAVIGNFESQRPPRGVVRTIARLAAWKLHRDDRDPRGRIRVTSQGSDKYPEGQRVRLPVIDGHRDTNDTACPGQRLYDRLPAIRRQAENRIEASTGG